MLKAVREKGQVTQKGRPIRITLDFSKDIKKSRGALTEVLQFLREHK